MHSTIITGDQLVEIHAETTLTGVFDQGTTWGFRGRHPDLGAVVITGNTGSQYDLRSERIYAFRRADRPCPEHYLEWRG